MAAKAIRKEMVLFRRIVDRITATANVSDIKTTKPLVKQKAMNQFLNLSK